MKLLILGGTREANALASLLIERGYDVMTSLAGRTREPRPPIGQFRVGGFGGVEGLAEHLMEEGFDALIDATHPFAQTITSNAIQAARLTNLPLMALWREPWARREGDDWRMVATIMEAAAALPSNSKPLIALGRQHVAPFLERTDLQLVLRSIEPISRIEGLPNVTAVRARPASESSEEARFMGDVGVTHVVSRNSGGAGAYAKIEAARMLGLPVIMIARAASPEAYVGTIDEMVQWVEGLPSNA